MALEPDFLTLLAKTAFGAGNLFDGNVNEIVGANPKVIGALLDLENLMFYDERYEVRAWLTGYVTTDTTTTISVDDVTDFEVGGKLRFNDVSENTWEEETIASIEVEAGTVTVETAPSSAYKTGVDYVSMIRPFLPDDKFIMMATVVEGNPIAIYYDAPFDLDRHYGIKTDSHEEWDPSGIFIRVQNKGLPVLMQRDALYILDVN